MCMISLAMTKGSHLKHVLCDIFPAMMIVLYLSDGLFLDHTGDVSLKAVQHDGCLVECKLEKLGTMSMEYDSKNT